MNELPQPKAPRIPGRFGCLPAILWVAPLLLLPPMYCVKELGLHAIFNYFAQDAFYYLAVGMHSKLGFYTFDGELPTNGFHPLWQIIVTFLVDSADKTDQAGVISRVFIVSVLLTVTGFCAAVFAAYRITRSNLLALLMVPGPFYLAFSFAYPGHGSPWSFMNGMESCLTVFFGGAVLALTAVLCGEPGERRMERYLWPALGLLIALMIMSRLDDVFLPASLGACVLFSTRDSLRVRLKRVLFLCLPSAAVLTGYLAFNYFAVGVILPVSGLAKGRFSFLVNLKQLYILLNLGPFPADLHFDLFYRTALYHHIQMICPILAALFLMALLRAKLKGDTGRGH
ncbi:MAG: hypothetical protein V2B18_17240, partial [Pseudomonadota bacterium]